eukprot:GILK01000684.1.p1 GENE.GILK01000684.1~~GILK01000684.1.p1  ORF type:complete len:235 (+),score=15.52 GILK01000684.1:50-754(+)
MAAREGGRRRDLLVPTCVLACVMTLWLIPAQAAAVSTKERTELTTPSGPLPPQAPYQRSANTKTDGNQFRFAQSQAQTAQKLSPAIGGALAGGAMGLAAGAMGGGMGMMGPMGMGMGMMAPYGMMGGMLGGGMGGMSSMQQSGYPGGFRAFRGNPDIEACVGCRFIWENVEMDLGDVSDSNEISKAFMFYCKDVPEIFHDPCGEMSDQAKAMIQDYKQGFPVYQLCQRADMCRY